MTESVINYCYVHPTREATLRCKRCERYICTSCAVRTPTGYMCRNCIREHQKSFDTAEGPDFILGFMAAGLLSAVATFLVTLIGGIGFFGWFLIFIGAPIAATTIAESVRYATRRHRSRPLFITCVAGVVAGGLSIVCFSCLCPDSFFVVFYVVFSIFFAAPCCSTNHSLPH